MISKHIGRMSRPGYAPSNSCPPMILRLKAYTADIVGCMFACAHLTNTSLPALLGDADADAYEILFSFASPEEKRQFLDLIRANEDLGSDYIENDFMLPTTEEIRNARPLQTIPA